MKTKLLTLATAFAMVACGGGTEDTADAKNADAQKLAAAKTCDAGLTLSGDTCVHPASRPAPGQALETK